MTAHLLDGCGAMAVAQRAEYFRTDGVMKQCRPHELEVSSEPFWSATLAPRMTGARLPTQPNCQELAR